MRTDRQISPPGDPDDVRESNVGLPAFHGHPTKRGIGYRREVFHDEEEKAVHP